MYQQSAQGDIRTCRYIYKVEHPVFVYLHIICISKKNAKNALRTQINANREPAKKRQRRQLPFRSSLVLFLIIITRFNRVLNLTSYLYYVKQTERIFRKKTCYIAVQTEAFHFISFSNYILSRSYNVMCSKKNYHVPKESVQLVKLLK